MTFKYSHAETDLDSSAVAEVYYAESTSDLAVVLNSGYAYLYSHVPLAEYERLVGSWSAGREYATVIKRQYGPGESLGYLGYDSPYFVENVAAPAVAAVGMPKGLTYAPNGVLSSGVSEFFNLNTNTSNVTAPKTRSHRVEFVVDNGNDVKSYNVETDSVDSAVAALNDVAMALDLDFTVKGVYVSFE